VKVKKNHLKSLFFFFRSKHPATFAELQLKEKGTTSAAVEEAVLPHLVERTKKLGIGR
jgi:hypothetical protein